MSTGKKFPDARDTIANHERRIDALERRLNRRGSGGDQELIFNLAGPLFLSQSGRGYVRGGGRLVDILLSLDVPGSTETEVLVQKNGGTLETVTIPADVALVKLPQRELFAGDIDYAQAEVTTVGTGAEDLTVQLRFV